MNQELKNGNPDAFKELFRQAYPRLMGYCRLFVPGPQQAKDLVQECFIKLWEKRQSIKALFGQEKYT
jgi:RNA polymerase sigma-70 factor (ECF subfamily)